MLIASKFEELNEVRVVLERCTSESVSNSSGGQEECRMSLVIFVSWHPLAVILCHANLPIHCDVCDAMVM